MQEKKNLVFWVLQDLYSSFAATDIATPVELLLVLVSKESQISEG